jgi:hypothetical protein
MYLTNMRRELEKVGRTTITVRATGTYPVKRETRVADVAVYQNNGTERISPSRFVERADVAAGGWVEEADRDIAAALNGDGDALQRLGDAVAEGIHVMCDRIDTGRLKASFDAEVTD